jgi:hypothetical protein
MDEQKPDLRAAYRTLDPAKPLDGSALSTYYAQRPGAPTAKLAVEILERTTQPFRAIVAGQRGVGKTTELNWLKGELERSSEHVFLFDLGRVATTNAVTALAFITKGLALQIASERSELVRKHGWLDWDFEIIGAVLDKTQLTDVLGTLKLVAAGIQQQRGRELVLLLDGWERVASNVEVYPFMDALERVNCSTVFVTRLSVILEPSIQRFIPDWDLTVLPAIPLFAYSRMRDEEGWSLLRTALNKRAGKLAFSSDAVRVIIQASGGLFRELVSLARHACLLAEQARKDQVTVAEAEDALTQQRLKHTATLTPGERELLRGFAQQRDRKSVDQSILEQVNLGRIVGYSRESLWFDVHPILWPLVDLGYPQ